MKPVLFASTFILVAAMSCFADDLISIKYSNHDDLGQTASSLPLFFGSIGIDAYYYRPGAGPVSQNSTVGGTANNIENNDWSEWNMVPVGTAGAFDFLVPPKGDIDLTSIGDSQLTSQFSNAYVANVGFFSFDFLFITGIPNVVLPDSTVCGWSYYFEHPAVLEARFPDLHLYQPGTISPACMKFPQYSGTLVEGTVLAIVARKDWFPDPVIVSARVANNGNVDCWNADRPLNDFQVEMVDSVMAAQSLTQGRSTTYWPADNYQTSVCSRTGYVFGPAAVIIGPESGDVPLIQLHQKYVPTPPVVTPNGNLIPLPASRMVGSKFQATVNFNLYPSEIANWSILDNPVNYNADMLPDGGFSAVDAYDTIQMAPRANGLPWGLSVNFVSTAPAITP